MAAEPAAPPPTSYDRLIKACLQKFYPDLAAWLIGERPEEVRAIDPVLTSPSLRFADKLLFLKLKKNAPGLLHVEFQAEGDAAMPKRILAYIALLLKTLEKLEEEERQAIRPASVVIYLSKEGYRADPGFFDLSGYLDFKLSIAYKVIKLWEVDPRPIFELESPGLLPFVPLMAGNPESLVLKSCEKITRCPEALAAAETKRELLAILAGLAGKVIKDEVLRGHLISEIRVMGENFILDYFREEGIAIGKVQGREEGRQEGFQEGAKKEARLAVLRVLRRRFGEISFELSERLEAFKDLERLEGLHDEAVVCPSLEAFLALLYKV